MKYFIAALIVLFYNQSVTAVLRHEKFDVYSGYLVNTVDETIMTRSASMCAAACDTRNDVIPNTCMTATYNSALKTCQFSSQGLFDATSGFGPEYKTISMMQDCTIPPTIPNADFVIDSQTATGSVGTMYCYTGYEPLPNSPVTIECSIYSGWAIAGMGCMLPAETSYYGTSFVTGFMQNGENNDGVPTITVLSPSGEAAVNILVPYLSINEQATTVGGVLTRTFPNTAACSITGAISAKAFSVTSDVPVMLFSGNLKSGSSDGSFVLPETSLGVDYIISGHPSTLAGTDEFIIIGTVDSTQVTLVYNTAQQVTITLNRMEVYHHQAVDMSGTMINAGAPVFVLSGHVCANIPDNTVTYCDYIDEIMPPLNSLGTAHIVTFMKPRSDFTISLVSTVQNTAIVYDDLGNLKEQIDLTPQFAQFRTYTNSRTFSIVSNFPVLVTQYGHGSTLVLGDPSMMVIPDVNHFGHVYEFVVPTGFNSPSTLAVVMPEIYSVSGLLLDNVPVTVGQQLTANVPGYGIFNVIYVDVSAGNHRLSHISGNTVSFGGWVYGRTTNQEYAWTLGMSI